MMQPLLRHKIAFIKSGSFSHINDSVLRQLQRNFPGHELITYDVRELFLNHRLFAARNLLHILQVYGVRGFLRRGDPVDCFIQTPAAFNFLKRFFARNIDPAQFAFTFQTQSLWDASTPEVPHFVYTDHTELANLQYPDFDRTELLGPWWTALEKTIYNNATANFAMSRNVMASMVGDYGCSENRVRFLGAGSNTPMSETWDASIERYRQKIILFVGVVWERKGGPELAAAFQKVLLKHPDARLRIVGCTPSLDLPNCDILGKLSLAEVKKEYERAAIFCLPTRREPFGIVFVEAMSFGLPVVATEIGAIPDFVTQGENGHRVKVGDVPGLARVLSELLDDPQKLQRFGQVSARKAREIYSWDKVGQRMKDDIESAIARG